MKTSSYLDLLSPRNYNELGALRQNPRKCHLRRSGLVLLADFGQLVNNAEDLWEVFLGISLKQ